ncbi:hypothetical protein CN899_21915 [Bacillus thuringiensis]|uniref:Uncharacterized protein n=1 Tax=Bacillus thuringiensis TaxID=1428 RepID=A0A9X7GH58_BACTU|nr:MULTISPECIES: DUF6262 family protein [Bacillus cereus group]ALC52353.1 hypothetical protein ACN91_12400 [Bacillus cereus]PGH80382.1 hypothetical protein CN899_21915 [Bacillus thuringiensis]
MNTGLMQYQEKKRQESIEKVRWAIQTLKDLEGESVIIRPEKIIEMTGLSKTAIYKPHLRTIWDQQWIGPPVNSDNMISKIQHNKKVAELEKEVQCINKQLDKAETKMNNLEKKLELETSRSRVFINEYEEQKKENEKLLYKYLKLLRVLHVRGIEINELLED